MKRKKDDCQKFPPLSFSDHDEIRFEKVSSCIEKELKLIGVNYKRALVARAIFNAGLISLEKKYKLS